MSKMFFINLMKSYLTYKNANQEYFLGLCFMWFPITNFVFALHLAMK